MGGCRVLRKLVVSVCLCAPRPQAQVAVSEKSSPADTLAEPLPASRQTGCDSDAADDVPADGAPICRVCLSGEEEEEEGPLMSPCGCKGTTQWVHAKCLATWMRTTALRGGMPLRCELCTEPYDLQACRKAGMTGLQLRHPGSKHLETWLRYFRYAWPGMLLVLVCLGALTGGTATWREGALFCAATVACRWVMGGLEGAMTMTLEARFRGEAVPSLQPGVLLCFRGIRGGPFAQSVVLITEYDYRHGAVGYIVNKPLQPHEPAATPFASLPALSNIYIYIYIYIFIVYI